VYGNRERYDTLGTLALKWTIESCINHLDFPCFLLSRSQVLSNEQEDEPKEHTSCREPDWSWPVKLASEQSAGDVSSGQGGERADREREAQSDPVLFLLAFILTHNAIDWHTQSPKRGLKDLQRVG
jgi:hypothetical protein